MAGDGLDGALCTQQLPLADDVDLDMVAGLTGGFSAADLQAVCSDAQLESVHSFLSKNSSMASSSFPSSLAQGGMSAREAHELKPVITMEQLRSSALNARPSVPEVERGRLNAIYESFMGEKRLSSSKVWLFMTLVKTSLMESSLNMIIRHVLRYPAATLLDSEFSLYVQLSYCFGSAWVFVLLYHDMNHKM